MKTMDQMDFYFKGRALKKEGKNELAFEAYQNAIRHGDPKGYYGLTLLAENSGETNETLSKMYADCFLEIKKAALNGDYTAAAIVGIYYAMGLGNIDQNFEQAHMWFLIGALGGDEVAQFNLAVHCYLGITVEKSLDTAKKWLGLAMERRYEPAIVLYDEIEKSEINFLETGGT